MNIIMKFLDTLKTFVNKYEANTKSYDFYNCDEWKSADSMNPIYNKESFLDTRGGRRALWAKIKEELRDGNIVIDEADLPAARTCVFEGDPAEASDYITYGCIISKEMFR